MILGFFFFIFLSTVWIPILRRIFVVMTLVLKSWSWSSKPWIFFNGIQILDSSFFTLPDSPPAWKKALRPFISLPHNLNSGRNYLNSNRNRCLVWRVLKWNYSCFCVNEVESFSARVKLLYWSSTTRVWHDLILVWRFLYSVLYFVERLQLM